MKISTLIIDDEPIALEKLRSYVLKTPFLELAGACRSGLEAIEFLSNQSVDLIVTDINMPDLNGLDFVRALPSPPPVIFTTAYADYAVESYRVSALDYLLKPYDYAAFHRAVCKARERLKPNDLPSAAPARSIFIKVDYRHVRVNLDDILYIKGFGEYLQIFLVGRDTPLTTLSSFAAIMERLTPEFIQVHRSFIVNVNHILQIERNRLLLPGDTLIPVSDSFRPSLQRIL